MGDMRKGADTPCWELWIVLYLHTKHIRKTPQLKTVSMEEGNQERQPQHILISNNSSV